MNERKEIPRYNCLQWGSPASRWFIPCTSQGKPQLLSWYPYTILRSVTILSDSCYPYLSIAIQKMTSKINADNQDQIETGWYGKSTAAFLVFYGKPIAACYITVTSSNLLSQITTHTAISCPTYLGNPVVILILYLPSTPWISVCTWLKHHYSLLNRLLHSDQTHSGLLPTPISEWSLLA